MAVRFDASTDNYQRTTNLPGITAFTIMGWFMRAGTGSDSYEAIFSYGNATSEYAAYMHKPSQSIWLLTEWTADFNGSAISDNVWYHLAMTCAGTGVGQLLGYMNGALNITANGASITGSTLRINAGPASTGEWANFRAAALKIYSGVLAAAEIANEMRFYTPQRTANLNAWYPLLSVADDEIDYSGNARNWTVAGTITTEDGPPIAWSRGTSRIFIPVAAALNTSFVFLPASASQRHAIRR